MNDVQGGVFTKETMEKYCTKCRRNGTTMCKENKFGKLKDKNKERKFTKEEMEKIMNVCFEPIG
jgi:ketopantoate reductase